LGQAKAGGPAENPKFDKLLQFWFNWISDIKRSTAGMSI
jgi:hypothetical protein